MVDFMHPPTVVALPAQGERKANILCQSYANMNMPLDFTWENGSGQPLMEGGELGLEFSSDSKSLSYIRANILNSSTSTNVSCIANRIAGSMTATITLSVIGKLRWK